MPNESIEPLIWACLISILLLCAHRSFMSCAVPAQPDTNCVSCAVEQGGQSFIRINWAQGKLLRCLCSGVHDVRCVCVQYIHQFIFFVCNSFASLFANQLCAGSAEDFANTLWGRINYGMLVILWIIHPRPNCPVAVLLSGMTRSQYIVRMLKSLVRKW